MEAGISERTSLQTMPVSSLECGIAKVTRPHPDHGSGFGSISWLVLRRAIQLSPRPDLSYA